MRLLRLEADGEFSLVEFVGKNIPRYAILSHTWGADDEEVTFKDLADGAGKSKSGYSKISFCGKQAAKDDLQYFWVDTCCIDKSSSADLSEAINSMFRWYRDAAKCYVYLSDVSIGGSVGSDLSSQGIWKPAFQHSRWFTRGWTLQELIAPASVEFFSVEGERLGDKKSLVRQIHEITGIAVQAFQGGPLFHYSINERMSWAAKRETKREEDAAYSLLGIFDICMPLLYGEGKEKAFSRLGSEIHKCSVETRYGNARAIYSSSHAARRSTIISDSIVIAVMGVNGAGKSTFINQVSDYSAEVGHSLTACTTQVDLYQATLPDGTRLFLVDTPGFDRTFQGGPNPLVEMADWLSDTYGSEVKLTGIVYLHRISDVRMNGSAMHSLRIFKALCGTNALRNVVLATTAWSEVNRELAILRERELATSPEYWASMIEHGSTVKRLDRGRESAVEIISYLIWNCKPATLRLTEELGRGLRLENTAAGREIANWEF